MTGPDDVETVANGRVVEHETFDCYEPLPGR